MPIENIQDAHEVDNCLDLILAATDKDSRGQKIKELFVEVLDYYPEDRFIPLSSASNPDLPENARIIARHDGVSVVYISLCNSSDWVTAAVASAAAKAVSKVLADDLLMLFTNRSGDQLHIIHPTEIDRRPRLQRMVVRQGQPRRTIVQQIANMWDDYGRQGKTIVEAIRVAFSIEPVTTAFFAAYKCLFDNAKEQIKGFGNDEEQQHLFIQTLFNRLMFVYFLSRKGWLKFRDDTDYLNALWRDYEAAPDRADFYIARLHPLFFTGLNNPQSFDLMRNNPVLYDLIGNVPFLNGGLFEETELDRRSGISVPDSAIQPIFADLFDRFNFTVMESTPYDQEVAVDPEMLGKVFEELVTGRHESGAYYTPRPVVSFMCREAIKGYLDGQNTGLSGDTITKFVDARDTSGISSVAQARQVSVALDAVIVVDPACGSGAYLLGMMQELVELQIALYNVGLDARGLYDLKLHIISRNLYGVDRDEFAANIAQLRLWLSLAIEYEGDDPPPLPNLDFKITVGDSLLGPDPSPQIQSDLFRQRAYTIAEQLADLKEQHLRSNGQRKHNLGREITTLEKQLESVLTDPSDKMDWRIAFAEVFGKYGGFDIVVANPPYVRQELIGKDKPTLTKQYADAANGKSDLYCYFYARACQLLRDGGIHVFVCSNSWLDVGYGAKLQGYLLNHAHIQAIYESAVERQFSTADINTIISIIRKTSGNADSETRFVSLRAEFETALAKASQRREITMTRAALLSAGTEGKNFVGDKWGGKYLRAPNIYHHILDKCATQLVRLGEIAEVKFGIKTGANEFFYLTPQTIKKWGIEAEYCRPVMNSPQEARSIAVNSSTLHHQLFMCHKDKNALVGTGALAYIQWGEGKEYHKRPSTRNRPRWYDLGERDTTQLAMNYLIDTTSRTFYISDGLHFGDNFQKLYSDRVSPLQLCAVMNSTLSQLMFNILGRANFGGGLALVHESVFFRLLV